MYHFINQCTLFLKLCHCLVLTVLESIYGVKYFDTCNKIEVVLVTFYTTFYKYMQNFKIHNYNKGDIYKA